MTRATVATDKGDIEIELYTDRAPQAAANFGDLDRKGFHDHVVLHRVLPGVGHRGGRGRCGEERQVATDDRRESQWSEPAGHDDKGKEGLGGGSNRGDNRQPHRDE